MEESKRNKKASQEKSSYMEIDLDKAIAEVKKSKAKKVAVQIPEGLKTRLGGIVEALGKEGIEVFAFVDPCFGACDLKDREAKELGADLLVHFGHTQFVSRHFVETVYIPIEYKPNKGKILVLAEEASVLLKKNKLKKIGLCSTIQFKKYAEVLEKELKKKGFEVFLDKEEHQEKEGKNRGLEKGQVLGCNYSAVKAVEKNVEAVVFLGDGLFHPIGLAFSVNKRVFIANPMEGEVKELGTEKDLFLRKRIAMIEKTKQAKSIAIWVSTKGGQEKMGLALRLKKKFSEKGKKAFIFASDLIRADYIAGINVEAIVCTACPRIAIDDSASFKQPVITPEEALIVLGEKKIEDYSFG